MLACKRRQKTNTLLSELNLEEPCDCKVWKHFWSSSWKNVLISLWNGFLSSTWRWKPYKRGHGTGAKTRASYKPGLNFFLVFGGGTSRKRVGNYSYPFNSTCLWALVWHCNPCFIPNLECSHITNETGYHLMKLGISSQDLQDFYYGNTWFEAKIMSSSKVKLIPNWGWNSFEDKFRWENQLGPISFLIYCFHTDFLILPTVMTKLGGWGGVGWGPSNPSLEFWMYTSIGFNVRKRIRCM